jgi:ATPase subunit of ABC transporter with duplicated ATPase domains
MWKVHDLSAAFSDEPLFAHATFTVGATDRVGLVGPNGAGKSTLLAILAGEMRPATGHVEFPPGTRVGHFTQEVPDPALTVREFLGQAPGELAALARELRELTAALTGLAGERALDRLGGVQERYAQLGGWAYAARVDEVRDRLNVAHLADDARLGTLSGGEQARLMLARVLLDEPQVLLLDEPTNHLDASGIEWLGTQLAGFAGSVLVVTHDRAMLDRVATRIVEIDGIHDEPQHYAGGYTEYRAEKQRRWERLLLDFEAQEKARVRLAADIERTKDQARSVEQSTRNDKLRRYAKKVAAKAKARERRLTRQMQATSWIAEPQTRPPLVLAFRHSTAAVPGTAAVGGPLGFATGGTAGGGGSAEAGSTVLSAERITLSRGGRTLVLGLDLHVRPGERIVLTGANGTGKTTLLRALAGLDAPAAGHVRRAGPVALLPQTHDELRLKTSVLHFFRSRVPVYVDEAEALLRAYLFDDDRQHQPLATLSAGELRRLLLATIVNGPADVILLDEPTNFLDFDALDVVEEALRAFDGALVVVTHDALLPKSIACDRHLVLADGRLHEAD